MRITTPPRRRHAGTVIVVAAAIMLSLLLVIAGTVGGNPAEHGDDSSAITRVEVTTQDTGPEGPRAAGELVDKDARPITVADAYHGVGIMVCPTGTRLVEVADAYHGVGLGVCVEVGDTAKRTERGRRAPVRHSGLPCDRGEASST
jgi:hypothetical protein